MKNMNRHNNQASQDDANNMAWAVCDNFRSVVNPNIYKNHVITLLFIKYISDIWKNHHERYQAEYGNEPELIAELMKVERFVLPKEIDFYSLHERRHESGNGERIDQFLYNIEAANISKLRGVFQGISFNSNKFGDDKQKNELLRYVLEDFSKVELHPHSSLATISDITGNTCEFLIKNFAADSGEKANECYTPPGVSDLIAELMEPQKGDAICDPACGSGSLLIKCSQKIRERFNGSKEYALYGQEAVGSTWAMAKMNMFLHSEDNHRIEWGDTLRNPKLLTIDESLIRFDIVTASLPFSLEKWNHDEAENDRWGRYHRGIPPKTKGDYAFILHMLETLKPDTGRMGVVMPHGILFRGAAEGKIRRILIEENILDAVIGLPEKLFYGTAIPVVVLIFKKHKQDNKILFIDASHDHADGLNRNILRSEDIQKIIETCRKRASIDKYAYLATLEEITKNDFNLNIPRYIKTSEEEEIIDFMTVLDDREKIKKTLLDIEKEMDGYLKELGYGS